MADLDRLFDRQFLEGLARHMESFTQLGVLRDAMMYNDVDRYFEVSWNKSWQGWDKDSYNHMKAKYGPTKLREIIDKYGLAILPADFDSVCDEA